VTIRNIRPLAVALGLGAAGVAGAADAAKPMIVQASSNQQLADAVAGRLTATSATQGADVSVHCQGGVVTVTGYCRDNAHKTAVLDQIRVVPGVKQVRDGIEINPNAVIPAQAMDAQVPMGMRSTGNKVQRVGGMEEITPAQMPMGPVATQAPSGVMPTNGGAVIEPVPLGPTGAVMSPAEAPPLPPYAWPTYAPHNNVSRVAYPQAYPYNAFPFIGPYYPFPKVPLGWRSVRLDWEDGHWWIGKTSAPQDYWRVRFW
jgi:hypothetical protein